MDNLIYAGIGSRKTPNDICHIMSNIARQLSPTGWLLRSGHARGADQAFERGAIHKEIHLPWDGYNNKRANGTTHVVPLPDRNIMEIAAKYHPAWDRLDETSMLFMARNVTIVLGLDLETPAKMLCCWTPNSAITGGTGHALRVAEGFGIETFNFAKPEDQSRFTKFVLQR